VAGRHAWRPTVMPLPEACWGVAAAAVIEALRTGEPVTLA
jgi:hypothetical protein